MADSYVERYEEEHLTSNRVNLRIRIRFADGYLLELNESAVVEGEDISCNADFGYYAVDNLVTFTKNSAGSITDYFWAASS